MAEPVTLKALLVGHESEELVVPLTARFEGQPVTVTAVLERTAVYVPDPLEEVQRQLQVGSLLSWPVLKRLELFEVESADVRWLEPDPRNVRRLRRDSKRRGNQHAVEVRTGWNGSKRKPGAEQTAEHRRRSDERARSGG